MYISGERCVNLKGVLLSVQSYLLTYISLQHKKLVSSTHGQIGNLYK